MKHKTVYHFLVLSYLIMLLILTANAACDNGTPDGGGGSGSPGAISNDPNEISGSLGFGDQDTERYVQPGDWLNFQVYFENAPTATAAAQEIRITSTLSPQLDLSSLEFGEIALGAQTDMLLAGKQSGEFFISQKGTPYQIKVTVTLDTQTGVLTCYMRSWDPTQASAGYWPADAFAGILPPNDDTGRGEGHIAFRVKVKADATDQARIDTSADITFDNNPPITTNPAWFNTVYADSPSVPVIDTQPASVAATVGGTASFSVVATGYDPLSYQWFKDGVALDGQTSATLNLSGVTSADVGAYSVTITNIFQQVSSDAASLTLLAAPVAGWAAGAGSQTVQEGATVAFAVDVTAGSEPFTYKWYKNNTLITGATGVSYTAPAATFADNGAAYRVEVSNAAGTVSLTAALTVTPSPTTIAQQYKTQLEAPGTATVTLGGTVDFSLVDGVTVASGKTITSADASTTITGGLTVPAGANNVVILGMNFTNGALAIDGATDVDVEHCTFTDASVSVTGGADNVSFSWNKFTATASGDGSAMRIADAGANTGIILDHNLFGDGLKSDMPAVTNARVLMVNNYITAGGATGNNTATIAGAGAQILSQNNIYQGVTNPLTQQNGGLIRALDNFMHLTAGTIVSGTDTVFVPGFSQVMQSAPLNGDTLAAQLTTYAGNTTGKTSITPPQTNGSAGITATVTGSGALANTTGANIPAAGGFTLTASATGFTPAAWQWYRDNFAIDGASKSTYAVTNALATANAGAYSVALTTSVPASDIVTAGAFTVTVGELAPPLITQQPASQTITAGNSATFTVVATGNMLAYQWQKNGVNVAGANSPALTITNAQQADAASYTVVVSNPAGTVVSNPATLTVNPAPVAPVITKQPVSQTITVGGSATFTVTATGDAPLSYQWKKDGAAISGATSASYTISNAQQTAAGSYTVVVNNPAGSATSNTATLTVNAASTGGNGGNNNSGGGGGGGAPSLLWLAAVAALLSQRLRLKLMSHAK